MKLPEKVKKKIELLEQAEFKLGDCDYCDNNLQSFRKGAWALWDVLGPDYVFALALLERALEQWRAHCEDASQDELENLRHMEADTLKAMKRHLEHLKNFDFI